ncbi:MAG: hypothetical protein IJ438_06740 [Clostridia bacterium]|nr:hypothetical protein [Clostridia bacterium]
MKKYIPILLALVLALTSLTAFAEEPLSSPTADDLANIADVSGFVMDVTEESILLQTPDGLYVEALLTTETEYEGLMPIIGDYTHVVYNGMMTRSLPAQVTAMSVRTHLLEGVVSNLTEEGFILTSEDSEYAINALSEQLLGILDGMSVTVYHNGAMTMSLPAQVSAEHVRGQEFVGTVTELIENGFLMNIEGAELPYCVYPAAEAMLFVQPEPGLTLRVVTDGVMTLGADMTIMNAIEVLPVPGVELSDAAGTIIEITDEFILIETLDGQRIQANIAPETAWEGKEITVGDYIHVAYDGQMTFSLPAQLAALKIGCYTHAGTVSDLSETQFILNTELEPILVHIQPEMAASLTDGDSVTVYTNGVMTMSLPAQVSAEVITAQVTIVD